MTKLIVILGVTGQQGSSVANHFLSLPQYTIRGLTRNTSSPLSISLLSKNISLMVTDLNLSSTLIPAFTGAHTIFATTDFWGPFYNPLTLSLLSPGQNLAEYCYEQELQQVKNIMEAAAHTNGLERLVISTLVDVGKVSERKYKHVWHWDSKARGLEWGLRKWPALREKVDEMYVPSYMENWMGKVKLRREKDGSYRLGMVGSGMNPLPHLDVAADLGAIVAAILESPPGKKMLAVGDMVSWSEQLRIWCDVNKIPFGGYDNLPIEVFEKFLPVPGLGTELGEMMAFIDGFGYVGGDTSILTPGQLVAPPRLTSWREYVEKHDWSSVLIA